MPEEPYGGLIQASWPVRHPSLLVLHPGNAPGVLQGYSTLVDADQASPALGTFCTTWAVLHVRRTDDLRRRRARRQISVAGRCKWSSKVKATVCRDERLVKCLLARFCPGATARGEALAASWMRSRAHGTIRWASCSQATPRARRLDGRLRRTPRRRVSAGPPLSATNTELRGGRYPDKLPPVPRPRRVRWRGCPAPQNSGGDLGWRPADPATTSCCVRLHPDNIMEFGAGDGPAQRVIAVVMACGSSGL